MQLGDLEKLAASEQNMQRRQQTAVVNGLNGLLDDQALVAFEVGARHFFAIEQTLADFVLADVSVN